MYVKGSVRREIFRYFLYTVKKTMNADPRRIGQIDIVFNFPAKEYTEKQKALLWAAAESCPVGRSLHPDVIVNITMNFQG